MLQETKEDKYTWHHNETYGKLEGYNKKPQG